MKRVSLPKGRSLSQIAYGVWRLSQADDNSVNLAHIDACLAQGISTFDHADIYGDYRCEALFGQAIKARPSLREQLELSLAHVKRKASKCRWSGKPGSSSMSSPWATRSPKSSA